MDLTSIKIIKELSEKHGFGLTKSLGQNFLINKEIPIKIAKAAEIVKDGTVLEIGPGIGCLTNELSKIAKKVIAVEIDKKLIPILNETLADCENVEIINEDILKINLVELCNKYNITTVCANLPYYITTTVIMKLLESKLPINNITVMIQKEVAQRFCSKPDTKEYGAITAAINYYAEIKSVFDVSAGNFLPKPKVDSTVINLKIIPPPVSVKEEAILFKVIRAGFSMRRKTLVNNIEKEFGIGKKEIGEMLKRIDINENARAETLDLKKFADVANEIYELKIKE